MREYRFSSIGHICFSNRLLQLKRPACATRDSIVFHFLISVYSKGVGLALHYFFAAAAVSVRVEGAALYRAAAVSVRRGWSIAP